MSREASFEATKGANTVFCKNYLCLAPSKHSVNVGSVKYTDNC